VTESRRGGRPRAKRASARASTKAASEPSARTAAKTRVKASKPAKALKPANASKPAKVVRDVTFEKISALCLALPGTKLTMTWGSPHFRVADKIFCGFGTKDGTPVLGVKLALEHARQVVREPRFWVAPYVGKHGWVSMDVAQRRSWDEVAALIRESYELIAPKALLAKLR
jgi:predicted DNA-binding protein (MmcQ/YjbR family)